MLTLFYDGRCPLCQKEMRALAKADRIGKLRLVNLHRDNFERDFPYIDFDRAMKVLHAEVDGKILTGVQANIAAWQAVGRKPWLKALGWPVIRPCVEVLYRVFANNRYRISWWLTGQARCEDTYCNTTPDACDFYREDELR